MKKNTAFGLCTASVIYIILVSIIPVLGIGAKGTTINTMMKAGIFAAYFLIMFFRSKGSISVNGVAGYVIFSYLVSQSVNIIFNITEISILNVLIQAAMFYMLLFVLPTVNTTQDEIIKAVKLFVAFDFIAIFYNIFINFERFANLSFLTNIYYDMYSFFDNKNTYGMFLFVAFALLFYWYYLCDNKKTKKWIVTLICVQFFAIAVSMCRTALVCALLFLMLNLFKKITTKTVILTVLLIIFTIIVFLLPASREYVLYVLFRVDVDTFREPIVEASLKIVRENLWFGIGQGAWNEILESIADNAYSHNGLLSVLMTGGVVYCVAYLTLFIKFFKMSFSIRKMNRNLGNQIIFFLISICVYTFFESVILCESNAANFSFTLGAIIIPQLYVNMMKNSCSNNVVKNDL